MIALFPTARVLKWLDTTRCAHVHNRFDAVCNLVNDHDEMVSLVAPEIGCGPFSVVLDESVAAEWHTNTPVTITDRTIHIGRTTITIDTTAIWNAKPDWPRLRTLNFAALPQPHHFSAEIDQKLTKLLASITANDPRPISMSTAWLAGRGAGLTPTGDDVLMGVLFALHVWRSDSALTQQIADVAAPRTTAVSANFLQAAAAGEAVAAWHDLVSAETNTKPAVVERILAVGATSGADAWSGFVQACTMFSQHTFETT